MEARRSSREAKQVASTIDLCEKPETWQTLNLVPSSHFAKIAISRSKNHSE
jgi:hypothetical protein